MGPKILEILKFRPLKFSFINTNVYLKKWPVVLRKNKYLSYFFKGKKSSKNHICFFYEF
jgi:hypothetical protein